MDTCLITGFPTEYGGRITVLPPDGLNFSYQFRPLGIAVLSNPAFALLQAQANQAPKRPWLWHPVLAGICRSYFEDGKSPFVITTDIVNNGPGEIWYPKTFSEKRDYFLKYLLRRKRGDTKSKGGEFFEGEETLAFANTPQEFVNILTELEQQGFITWELYFKYKGYPADMKVIILTDEGVKEAIRLTPRPDSFAAPDLLVSTGDAALDSRLNHARQLFFKQSATTEDMRSACETLCHILEPIREDKILIAAVSSEKDVDNFFQIVNKFDIRHNKPGTMNLKHVEQYEWVFNSLLNSIMVYAKLKKRLVSLGSSTSSAPTAAV